MKTTIRSILAVMFTWILYAPAFATDTDTMSCAGGIVSIGTSAGEVVAKCGQPAYAIQREEKIVEEGPRGSRVRAVASVIIDDWTFNFGPDRFQYRVVLRNGFVARIESLDYGY